MQIDNKKINPPDKGTTSLFVNDLCVEYFLSNSNFFLIKKWFITNVENNVKRIT